MLNYGMTQHILALLLFIVFLLLIVGLISPYVVFGSTRYEPNRKNVLKYLGTLFIILFVWLAFTTHGKMISVGKMITVLTTLSSDVIDMAIDMAGVFVVPALSTIVFFIVNRKYPKNRINWKSIFLSSVISTAIGCIIVIILMFIQPDPFAIIALFMVGIVGFIITFSYLIILNIVYVLILKLISVASSK